MNDDRRDKIIGINATKRLARRSVMTWLAALGMGLLISTSGCYYDNAEDLYPPPPVDTVDTTVSFEDDIQPFIATTCAISSGCHSDGSNYPVFESYDQIKAKVDRIEARVLIEKTMPPSGQPQPTPEELDDLRQWIDDGAPNN